MDIGHMPLAHESYHSFRIDLNNGYQFKVPSHFNWIICNGSITSSLSYVMLLKPDPFTI